MLKNLRYFLEYIPLKLFSLLCSILSPEQASNLGGFIGRIIGPKLAKSRTAKKHLKFAFPDWSENQYEETVKSMWENLGRLLAEYPHLRKISNPDSGYSDVKDPNGVLEDIQNKKSTFLIGAHIANWEVLQSCIKSRASNSFSGIYREPNNPFSAGLLAKMRQTYDNLETIPKSSQGARDILKFMKQNKHIGLLVDQKYNEGTPVPFFGKDAMTGTGFIALCQKYDYQIVPGHLERLEGPRFCLTLENKINLFGKDGSPRSEYDVMVDIHARLEDWIKQHPEQWIWIHRRWPRG